MSEKWINTPEWDQAEKYWQAFWHGERLDRPPLMIYVPNPNHTMTEPEPKDYETKHNDPEFILQCNEAKLPGQYYLGEALPVSKTLQSAWCPTYGFGVEYHPDTIWINPGITDWNLAPDWHKDWDDEGWRTLRKAYACLVEGAGGRYFVGMPPLLVPNDLLSVLRGVERFLIDLIMAPELVLEALEIMQRNYVRMWNELDAMRDCSQGYGNWWPIWCPDRLRVVQSDVSCMLSREMFERFVLPELYVLGEDVDHLFYHLDGPDAIRHLDMVCSVPKIKAIQWVPGAGQPQDGLYWMDLFKKIQSFGKCVWTGGSPDQLETYIEELDPGRLLLGTRAESIEEAQQIKQKVASWTAKYWGRKA